MDFINISILDVLEILLTDCIYLWMQVAVASRLSSEVSPRKIKYVFFTKTTSIP